MEGSFSLRLIPSLQLHPLLLFFLDIQFTLMKFMFLSTSFDPCVGFVAMYPIGLEFDHVWRIMSLNQA